MSALAPWLRVRLWVRLAVAMGLLAVVPVVVVSLSAMQIATRLAEKASQDELRHDASARAEFVGRWLDDQALALLTWPQQFGDSLGGMSLAAQESFPRMVYRNLPSAVTVVLVDGTGRQVVEPAFVSAPTDGHAGSSEARARDLVARLPLRDAIAQPDSVHVGAAWLPDGDGTRGSIPLAVLAASASDPAAVRVVGAELALAMDADSDSDHGIALLDAQGLPLVGGAHRLIEPARLRPLLGTDHQIDFILEGVDGEVRGSLAPVPSSPGWTVVVAEPASVVLRPGAAIRERMIALLVVAGGSALVVAVAFAGTLSRPIERLRHAALRVADGELGVRADIGRSDEIGELGQAFDHMSSRLAGNRGEILEQQAEIEAFAQELQQRVDQRTLELRTAQDELVRTGQLAAVAELGAGLAHELNNPLAAVLGLAQVLSANNPGDSMLSDLAREAGRCRDVVATLVRVTSSELDHGRASVVDLADVWTQAVDLVGGSFRQRGVALGAPDPFPDVRVRVDAVQTSRLLAQILNALRAGLEQGATVSVSIERLGERIALRCVADRPVAVLTDHRDDWMASAHGLWVAAQLLERLGGRLERRKDGYIVYLPGA